MCAGQRLVPALLLVFCGAQVSALIELDGDIDRLQFRHPNLEFPVRVLKLHELPPQASEKAQRAIEKLNASRGDIDERGGRFSTLVAQNPYTPGPGNSLSSLDGGVDAVAAVWEAFIEFIKVHQQEFEIDPAELAANPKVTSNIDGSVVQIYAPRKHNGVEVMDSYMTCTVENGNAVLYGTNKWADITISTNVKISEEEALESIQEYLEDFTVDGTWGPSEVYIVPMAHNGRRGRRLQNNIFKRGYQPRLVLKILPKVKDYDIENFAALVDARTGSLLSFEDENDYLFDAKVVGGVHPVSNDGQVPDGNEHGLWPMPHVYVTLSGSSQATMETDSGGNLIDVPDGATLETNLTGPLIKIEDQCGPISLKTASGVLDFSTSSGTDCTTPGSDYGGQGNTKAARTAFHELNMAKAMASSHLPDNEWLQQELVARTNIDKSCNAYYNGRVNFLRSNSNCGNTGEISTVLVHEFGHGLDSHDANDKHSKPSSDGIADLFAAIRSGTSCVARGFFKNQNCHPNKDPCLDCTGVRDIDYLKRESQQPHTLTWANNNCNDSVHCLGYVYAEAVWSLWKRELQGPPYNMDDNTAHELVTYLTFVGGGNVDTWFDSESSPYGGCSANSGYMQYLSADDPDGNLSNGTPHMTAIFNAFNAQEIACDDLTVQDSGCEEVVSMSAPIVTAVALDKSVSLSWTSVSGTDKYEIFRTDGVFDCSFGKIRLGETTGLSFTNTDLLNGRNYSYVVIPKGNGNSCFGPASDCIWATPVPGNCEFVDFENGFAGWYNDEAASSCVTGTFVVDEPNEVFSRGVRTQVGGDHTSNGGKALFTVPNTSSGTEDVDKGECRVVSPEYIVTVPSYLSLWYFFGQRDTGDDSADFFSIDMSTNGGGSWTSLISKGDERTEAEWTQLRASVVENFILRVRVSDGPSTGDLIEFGIDDILICPMSCTIVDFEHDSSNWVSSAAGSSCSTGTFERGTPTKMTSGSVTTQVAGDHTSGGGNAFYTAANAKAGSDDVDAGTCVGESPEFAVVDESGISVFYFHGQRDSGDDSADGFHLEMSTDGGSSWTTLVNEGDVRSEAEWTQATAAVPSNSNLKLRVSATDAAGPGDIVEAGLDDLTICPSFNPVIPPRCSVNVNFENGRAGWINDAESTCQTGMFIAGTPAEMSWTRNGETGISQVGGDHTTGTGNALYTAENTSRGTDDVDGGSCRVLSPTYDVAVDSLLSLWYFFGQRDSGDDDEDYMTIELSIDDGHSWTNLVSMGDVRRQAIWTEATETIPGGSAVKIRVKVSDGTSNGDLIEGGIDDLRICAL